MSTEIYFGADGPFAEACHKYQQGDLPPEVLSHAANLGKSQIAFCFGYAFGSVLLNRTMNISEEDLWKVARGKISYGDPVQFVNGFQSRILGIESPVTSHED